MFTGLIETICTVRSVRQSGGTMLLSIDLGELADDGRIGDSIAINGVCLTIAKLEGGLATFDLSAETLVKSTMGGLRPSSQVNVERAVRAADRFGGHFVQGHIDGTATIKAIDKHGRFADMKFAAEPGLLNAMVVKGSVAVDGISLTIASIDQNSFTVALIPETLNKTTLSRVKIGNEVNIETDIIVKTIKTQLEKILPQTQSLTAEKLKELGF
ncbi:Riboflavin synthase [subsurface metagenome]